MSGITDEGQPSNRWHYGCGTYVYCDEDGLEVAYIGDLCDARMEITELKRERHALRDVLCLIAMGTSCRECDGEDQARIAKEALKPLPFA